MHAYILHGTAGRKRRRIDDDGLDREDGEDARTDRVVAGRAGGRLPIGSAGRRPTDRAGGRVPELSNRVVATP
jgi:hypothetical protein